jgi:hypothetical protein
VDGGLCARVVLRILFRVRAGVFADAIGRCSVWIVLVIRRGDGVEMASE